MTILTIAHLEKLRPWFILVVVFSLLVACQKDTDAPVEYEYLVDYELNKVYSADAIKTMLLIQSVIYPEINDIEEYIDYGVQVYQVIYKTHYRDSVIEASGLVCVPANQSDFPVISFQNGTNTSHDNAPSVNPSNTNYMLMEAMASNGYVVLIPDYIGFGSSSDIVHPYYHRTSSDNAVIDLINAFNEMDEYDLFQANSNNKLYLMGYSQGGWATLSAMDKIENDMALDMDIGAVSCGAGAYSLLSMSEYVLGLETFPGPMYLPYYLYAHQFYGAIITPLSVFFKDPYYMIIPSLFDGSLDNDE
ncbi:MAG: alpha/beta hydrolase, partial [Bacteroidales bacterium]|nr:alpha/beta hydrolase [Bacteroidales bacterium]